MIILIGDIRILSLLTEAVFSSDLPDRVWVKEVIVRHSAQLMLAVTQVVLTAETLSSSLMIFLSDLYISFLK